MTDIVIRLRRIAGVLEWEAAEEIERLRAERDEYERHRNARCEHAADAFDKLEAEINRLRKEARYATRAALLLSEATFKRARPLR